MSSSAKNLLLVAALVATACGGVGSVDGALATGQVTGTLTNVPGAGSGKAYVYVFGRPELRAQVREDGSFVLEKVPVGNGQAQVMVYDGDTRAELVDVSVQPATRTHVEKRAPDMPLAGRIVAVARCPGGQKGDAAQFTVVGTEHEHKSGGPSVTLYPLPAGHTFTLRTALPGFRTAEKPVTVKAGSSEAVELDMDEDDDDSRPGCLSTGCSDGRACEKKDGKCYQCVSNADCTDPNASQCESHACVPSGAVFRSACLPCTSATQCAPGPGGSVAQPALCIPNGGVTVCSFACATNSDCPSGYSCSQVGGQLACVAAPSCSAVLAAFGAPCLDDAFCSTALADPHCQGKVKDPPVAGYCTSRCNVANGNADCPAFLGFRCVVSSSGEGTCIK